MKKEIAAWIPAHDADVLAKARKTAYRLDYSLFTFAGIRFGWSSIIGLVPAIGDVADAALALNLIRGMRKVECGLPSSVLIMMLVNLMIDFLVGLVPFLGDIADAAVKCNGKNVRLLEEHLDTVYKPDELRAKDAKLPRDRRPRPASVYVDFDDEAAGRRTEFANEHDDVRQPQRSYDGRRVPDVENQMAGSRKDTQRPLREERPSRTETKSSRR